IDPMKAKDVDSVIRFDFTDGKKQSVAMHIRHGVVEYIDNPVRYYKPAGLILELNGEAWAKLYRNEASVADLVKAGRLKVTGDVRQVDIQLALFDSFETAKNQFIPLPAR